MDNEKKKKPVRILIVDDDSELRATTKDVLAYHGITLGAAKDAAEAVRTLKASARMPYDLVLLDIGLQGKSGVDVLRQIRTELKSRIPVLIITGNPDRNVASEVAKLGISGILVKPYDPSILLDRIRKTLGSESKAA